MQHLLAGVAHALRQAKKVAAELVGRQACTPLALVTETGTKLFQRAVELAEVSY
jgi:hypothetical protein